MKRKIMMLQLCSKSTAFLQKGIFDMQTYAYGHDFGNAETCGVLIKGGKKLTNTIPSVTTQGSYDELNRLGISLGGNDFVFKHKNSDTEQFVGELAYKQANMSFSGRGDISRYWSEKSLTLLLTVAASLVDDSEFALNVVTGLPVQTYLGDPESRAKIKKALEGTHTFMVNRTVRTVHVKVERVIMEGAGATIAYGNRDKRIQGVIDIGGRTSDLFAAEGQTPQRHLCDGKPLGVEAAGDLLSTNFQRKYGRPLKNMEIRKAMRAYVRNDDYPVIIARGTEVMDLRELVQDALTQIGNEIVSFVSAKWNDAETGSEVASSFSTVMCIGGGAYYFYDSLLERIPNLLFIETPEEANAYGYAIFAEQQRLRFATVAS
jgi:hypothetical protein